MIYKIDYTNEALQGLSKLKKNEPASYKKALKLLKEISEHPRTGTGKPKPLSGNRVNQWSRRINDKHRLVYEIKDETLIVIMLSTYKHYDDK